MNRRILEMLEELAEAFGGSIVLRRVKKSPEPWVVTTSRGRVISAGSTVEGAILSAYLLGVA